MSRLRHEHVFEETLAMPLHGGEGRVAWASCECGMRRVERSLKGSVYELRYQVRPGSGWVHAVDLLLHRAPVRLCACIGEIPACQVCGGLGVLDRDGERIRS